jgi:hypothetical protein
MNENITFIAGLLPLKDSNEKTRVFIPSQNINIFPCSRRGQKTTEGSMLNYDPEARLNTERTNRLRTSINGFTDSFIVNDNFESGTTLTFTLAGYRIEVKEFDPAIIATALGITNGKIYAHLSLHDGIPFGVANYYTEILYKQSTNVDNNYIDVKYTDYNDKRTGDFFMGVSFTTYEAADTIVVNDTTKLLKEANLPLFSKVDDNDNWKLIEASKLPKVKHDTEPNSIKLSGDFTVEHTKDNGEKQTSFKVTKDETVLGPTVLSSLIVGEKADGDTFTNGTITAKNLVKTPALNVNSITSGSDKVEIDKPINVTGKATLTDELEVTDKATLKNGLDVTNGETVLQKLTATEVSADTITQNGNQVPVITLEQISDIGVTPKVWQLQIAHVIKKSKN